MIPPITDAERRRWQQQAFNALADILELGDTHDLPPLPWKVLPASLVAEIGGEDAARRGVFDRWVEVLGLTRQPDRDRGDGVTCLRASVEGWGGHRAAVAVMADIWPEEGW